MATAQLAATLICNASFSSISFFIGSTNNITPATAFPPIPHIFESDMSGVVWQRWLQGLSHKVRDTGQLDWTQLSFKGSKLTDLETRRHNDLQQIQGGASGDFYHLTLQQHDKVDVDEILLWLSF